MSDDPFSSALERWKAEQQTPWNQLRYRLARSNLDLYLPPGPLNILDAGGGNGTDSLPFAAGGHAVTLVDSSDAMLADARAQLPAEQHVYLTTLCADVANLATCLGTATFDVIICHNVIQYLPDPPALLHTLAQRLRPGGILSLLSVNRFSLPYQRAFLYQDLEGAWEAIDQAQVPTTIFGTTMTTYTSSDAQAWCQQAGLDVQQHYGIRCLCDYWGTNEQKYQPSLFAQLERIEYTLTDRDPYRQLARYYQVIARVPRD